MKRVNLSEREQAAFGPRSLKPVGSPEWCWQTLERLVADYKLIDERFNEVGAMLAELDEVRAWKIIPSNKPYGTRERMLAAELGVGSRRVKQEIDWARTRRAKAAHEIEAETPKLLEQGYNKEKDITLVKQRGTSNAYAIAKLRKDRPDIHARVLAGELSPHAGMVEAGFRKKVVRKKPSPIERLAGALAKLSDIEWQTLKRDEDARRQLQAKAS